VAPGLLCVCAVGGIATASTREHERTRVLVVESDPVQRTMVADWLGALPGVSVVAVASAGQAMACERPQGFHLCVLRHELGGVDGLTLGAMLRQLNAEARLVLLGSGACPHLVSLAREHGFTAVVDGALVREQVEGWVSD
jgi:CheY-like chemotaxis protein